MFVFDDGIVVGEPSKPGAGLYFGALGGVASVLAGQARNRRVATSIDEAMSALPDPSAKAVAAQVKRVRLLAIDHVTQVRLERGRGKARKLVVATRGGRDATFRFMTPKQPEGPVRDVLSDVFADRFIDAVADAS